MQCIVVARQEVDTGPTSLLEWEEDARQTPPRDVAEGGRSGVKLNRYKHWMGLPAKGLAYRRGTTRCCCGFACCAGTLPSTGHTVSPELSASAPTARAWRKKERKIYARLQACVKGALSQ